jgi:hypothetical protein
MLFRAFGAKFVLPIEERQKIFDANGIRTLIMRRKRRQHILCAMLSFNSGKTNCAYMLA